MKRMMMKQPMLLLIMLLFNVVTVFSQDLSSQNKMEYGKWGYEAVQLEEYERYESYKPQIRN